MGYAAKKAEMEQKNNKIRFVVLLVTLGVIAAGGSEEQLTHAKEYGLSLGLAFQIVDDILDVTSSAEVLGKPIGSDAENIKSTYVSALGLEKAGEYAALFTDQAIGALSAFNDTESLQQLTLKLLRRTN